MKRQRGQAIVEMALVLAILMPVGLLAIAVGFAVWEDGLATQATQNIANRAAVDPSMAPDDPVASDELARAGCASASWTLSEPDGDTQPGSRVEINAVCRFASILGGQGVVSVDRTSVIP